MVRYRLFNNQSDSFIFPPELIIYISDALSCVSRIGNLLIPRHINQFRNCSVFFSSFNLDKYQVLVTLVILIY